MTAPGALADKPFWAKCSGCSHCWPVAYYPLEAGLFAKIALRGCICPKCGVTEILVAKQDNGRLLEAVAETAERQTEEGTR